MRAAMGQDLLFIGGLGRDPNGAIKTASMGSDRLSIRHGQARPYNMS
jgi:hypothetical protein